MYDGHGGRQASSFAARKLLDHIVALVDEIEAEALDGHAPDFSVAPQDVEGEDLRMLEAQEAVVSRLPVALHRAFVQTDEEYNTKYQSSGTTATVALVCGWDLFVANVGDSCAYFDSGASVVLVSGNHRLDDNRAEQDRIVEQGGEIGQAMIENKTCGPLR